MIYSGILQNHQCSYFRITSCSVYCHSLTIHSLSLSKQPAKHTPPHWDYLEALLRASQMVHLFFFFFNPSSHRYRVIMWTVWQALRTGLRTSDFAQRSHCLTCSGASSNQALHLSHKQAVSEHLLHVMQADSETGRKQID